MTDSDDNRIIGIEILGIELMLSRNNLRATCISILCLHFLKVIFHHLLANLRIIENRLQVINLLHQVLIFLVQLIHAQTCKLAKTHINNGLGLQFIEFKTFLQIALGFNRGF